MVERASPVRKCLVSKALCTVYDDEVYHTPLGRFFHARYLYSWNSVGGAKKKKRSALETSRRELSEDVSFEDVNFDIDALLLVVEQSSLESRPSGV